MKDNKLYKVLRIVFLTLAIISLIFSLSKKFVHAEGATTSTSFPLPYGPGSNWGFSNPNEVRLPTNDELLDMVSQIETSTGNTVYGLFIYEIASDYSYVTFAVAFNDFWYLMPNNTYPSMPYNDFLNLRTLNTADVFNCQIWKLENNGSFYFTNSNINSPSQSYFFSSGVSYSDTYYGWYPFWHKDFSDILVSPDWSSSQVGFVYQGISGGGGFDGPGFTGEATGTLSPSEDFDGQGFNLDFDFSIDLNPLQVLGEEIKDGISDFKDRVVEGFQVIGGKIDTFKDRVVEGFQTLTSIPSKVSDIYDYITEPFDEEKFSEKFEEMELGQELTTFRTDIESFTGTFNVAPAAAEDVRFSIPFTLPYVNQNLTAVIDFSFYDRIRSIVVPFFTVFLIFGMVWSLIRSIPGILHGTSPDGDS